LQLVCTELHSFTYSNSNTVSIFQVLHMVVVRM